MNLDVEHKFVTVGETRIHYVEAGHGPTVVLLHGFPEFWYSWRNQIPALVAAGYRVIAPDLRGYNESSRPQEIESYCLPDLVRDVAGLITQCGDAPVTLIGHDWGGVIAWLVPRLHPALVGKLIVLNAPHSGPLLRELRRSTQQKMRLSYQLFMRMPMLPELWMRMFGYRNLQRTLRRMAKRAGNFDAAELHEYVDAWSKPGALTGMANYYRALPRSRKALRSSGNQPITNPTLLIWGERDPVFTHATTENFSEWVPNARVAYIEEAGHFVQSDAPEKVNKLIIDFLQE
jgi:pimeloyl-ACP methyl ester carboxylesterase